ncbi:MAG TPA: hypothetical protein VG456_02530 [Candidatus Sulfopaludibacter sp.]|jgi:hypothetical protein|nr:hypothetical protein [Candidatus Sulfopaludibacter sp.]
MIPFALLALAQVYQQNLPTGMEAPLRDPVSQFIATRPELAYRPGPLGYLPALLAALRINPDTQALVFSKTSFQSQKISPRNPRAVYFSDNVAVGYVPGGDVLEMASLDPRQGIVFYTLDARRSDAPRFARREECLKCHQGPATLGVPGIFIGSVFPNANGAPSRTAAIITDHRTPFADRWGGWFIDGTHGEQLGRANRVAGDPAEPESLDTRLAKSFDASAYLSSTSDVVALMVFEHQTQIVNMFTRLNWEARIPGTPPSQLESDLDATAAYLLFKGEAPLKEPIEGVSSFTRTFAREGPLREFDLRTRLFLYPLSYMIYSPAFDALPEDIRVRLCHRVSRGITPEVREIVKRSKPQLERMLR